jgi:hypothetical protein
MAQQHTNEIPRAILGAVFLFGIAMLWWLQVMR